MSTIMERVEQLESEVADLKHANTRLVQLVEKTRQDYLDLTDRLTAKVLAQLARENKNG